MLLGEERDPERASPSWAALVGVDYRERAGADGRDLLLVTVVKGAVMFVTDLARAIPLPTQLEFMAVSSYGLRRLSSSGVVRILKDLDRDINDRDVLIVEDVVDSGLDPVVVAAQPGHAASAVAAGVHAAAQARCRRGRPSTSTTSASTSPTSSSSATAWTTTSATAICRTSEPWTRGSTRTEVGRIPPLRPTKYYEDCAPDYRITDHRELLQIMGIGH